MNKINKTGLLARLALLAATLIWGSSFVVVKNTVDTVPPSLMVAIRFSVACILLAAVFNKYLREIDFAYLWQGAIMGICLFFAYFTQTIGITDTTPGKNAFLTAVYCVIVPFFFWITTKKRPDKYNIIAALVCFVGIGLVSLTSRFTISFGDTFTIIGGVFYAAHMVVVAMYCKKGRNAVLYTIIQFGAVAVFAWIATLFVDISSVVYTKTTIISIGFLAVFCTAVALLLQNLGQKHTPPSQAAIIMSLESVFGVLISLIFYADEVMSVKTAVGFILIFLAIIISETKLSFIKKKSKE